jgi:stress response protein YsnF
VHTAGSEQDMQHVNPYAGNEPLVASEPPPVQPAGGRLADPDATILPTTPRQAQAADPGATVLPTGGATASTAGGSPQPYNDQSDATVLSRPATPDSADTILSRPATPIAPAMSEAEPGRVEPETMREGTMSPSPTTIPAPTAPAAPTEVTVPVIEEQVAASAEWRDAGAITVRTVMEEIPQTLTHETERDEVFVERVSVGRVLEEGEEVTQREEDGVTIIPVIVEEAVVVTRRVLAEELRITKRTIPTVQTVQAVVHKERVEIDGGELADRVHDATGTDAATPPSEAARDDGTA